MDPAEGRIRPSNLHVSGKHPALAANLHLPAPTLLGLPPAEGSIYEPAVGARLEFPRRAGLAGLGRATPDLPAGKDAPLPPFFQSPKKEQLPLDMRRHLPPSLFEALHGPQSDSQEMGHLSLSPLKSFAQRYKFPGVQSFLLKRPHEIFRPP
jgi:hypothetical protein